MDRWRSVMTPWGKLFHSACKVVWLREKTSSQLARCTSRLVRYTSRGLRCISRAARWSFLPESSLFSQWGNRVLSVKEWSFFPVSNRFFLRVVRAGYSLSIGLEGIPLGLILFPLPSVTVMLTPGWLLWMKPMGSS